MRRITTTLGTLAIVLAGLGTAARGQMMNIPFGGGYGASLGGGGVSVGAAQPLYGGFGYGPNMYNTYGYGAPAPSNYTNTYGAPGLSSYNYTNTYGYRQPLAPGYAYGSGSGYAPGMNRSYSNNYGYSGGYYTPNYSYGNRTYAPTGYYTYGNRPYRRGWGWRRQRVYYYR
jgi:hypothetical protein